MASSINREAWLTRAIPYLAKLINKADTGITVPEDVGVSVGFPGGRSFHKVIGQCWAKGAGKGKAQVFVSPLLNDPHDVLAVLLHELIHAADDCKNQHKGPFRATWKAVGFVGKPTQSTPGEELAAELAKIAHRLGDFPHNGMDPAASTGIKKQVARQLKVECPQCGYVARVTRKWLDDAGAPFCGLCEGEHPEGEYGNYPVRMVEAA